jgi:hypothetical protein
MANLNVQPKKKNYLWVWIIVILLIAAGIYYYLNYYSKGIKPGSGNALSYPAHSGVYYSKQFVNKVTTPFVQASKFYNL